MSSDVAYDVRKDQPLLNPIIHTTQRFRLTLLILLALYILGLYAWMHQLRHGMVVTGMNIPVYWGFYITNFVFFIGISHAGTLISAILRIARAEWRRAITRSAEVITVMVILFGAGQVILDLGRPDRVWNVILHGNFSSPLIWDVCSITLYLTGSTFYLLLPLIPDLALLRDQTSTHPFLYRFLSFGFNFSETHWRRLERLINIMAHLVIPIAVSVHTVVSWVFAMTVQPMWHSTIFGPYFVMGAIYSGIAAIIIAMWIIRRFNRLESYFKEVHFHFLGSLLLVMTLLWFYFTLAEFLTTFYGQEPEHMAIFWEKLTGRYAPLFWMMVATNFVIPFTILSIKKLKTILGTLIASLSVVVGMWLERFIIVVPSLSRPRLPLAPGHYAPTWVEISLLVSSASTFILFYVLFAKFFPIISIWEIQEGRAKSVKEVSERLEGYLPQEAT